MAGNLDVWIQCITDKIGIRKFASSAEFDGDQLLGVKKILNKGDAIESLREEGFSKIVAVGDGMGDVAMFDKADVRIAFGGVHPPVKTLVENSDFIVYTEKTLCRTLNTLLRLREPAWA